VSEYQYYEFAAVDRALDDRQLGQLRALSSRAHITPTSFVNTYEWGKLSARGASCGGGGRGRHRRIVELRAVHPRKVSLLERLDRAGM
jgi:hypothetical protein